MSNPYQKCSFHTESQQLVPNHVHMYLLYECLFYWEIAFDEESEQNMKFNNFWWMCHMT